MIEERLDAFINAVMDILDEPSLDSISDIRDLAIEALQAQDAETEARVRKECAEAASKAIMKMCGTEDSGGCPVGRDMADAIHAACMNAKEE